MGRRRGGCHGSVRVRGIHAPDRRAPVDAAGLAVRRGASRRRKTRLLRLLLLLLLLLLC